jgi:hypothetical protein
VALFEAQSILPFLAALADDFGISKVKTFILSVEADGSLFSSINIVSLSNCKETKLPNNCYYNLTKYFR